MLYAMFLKLLHVHELDLCLCCTAACTASFYRLSTFTVVFTFVLLSFLRRSVNMFKRIINNFFSDRFFACTHNDVNKFCNSDHYRKVDQVKLLV